MNRPDKAALIRWAGRLTLAAALLLGAYVLIRFAIDSSRLPDGVCPLTRSRPIAYTAVGLSLVSLILSFFEKDPKKTAREQTGENDQEVR
ncbi:MAG: hypothetical protein PHP94_03685 [Eubacteriales bacterium]|nr:hypothetical protein [Eubacteriales bacterium]MDD4461395.1 hypothetical protein [Eubacteriales bacterium]